MENIKTVLILVELDNGNAHQVLATKENKKLALTILAQMEGKLLLDAELVPFELEKKQ